MTKVLIVLFIATVLAGCITYGAIIFTCWLFDISDQDKYK